ILQYGFQLGLSYRWEFLFVGGTSEFRFSEQYSPVKQDVGNYKGHYWSQIGPLIGVRWDEYIVSADAKLLGKYEINRRTEEGGEIRFTDPLGIRVAVLRQFWDFLYFGGHYEYLQFKRLEHSKSGPHNLGESQKLH